MIRDKGIKKKGHAEQCHLFFAAIIWFENRPFFHTRWKISLLSDGFYCLKTFARVLLTRAKCLKVQKNGMHAAQCIWYASQVTRIFFVCLQVYWFQINVRCKWDKVGRGWPKKILTQSLLCAPDWKIENCWKSLTTILEYWICSDILNPTQPLECCSALFSIPEAIFKEDIKTIT